MPEQGTHEMPFQTLASEKVETLMLPPKSTTPPWRGL